MKKAVFSISGALGLHRLYASLNRNHPIVLTFHGVTAETPGHICNDEGLHLHLPIFDALLRHVARNYRAVPLSTLVDWVEGRRGIPQRAVVVTFDDGYRDVLTNAAPVLRRLGVPATLFVVTDFVFHGRMLWPDRIVGALALTAERNLEFERDGVKHAFALRDRGEKIAAATRLTALCKSLDDSARLALVDEVVGRLGLDDARLPGAWDDLRPLEPDEMKRLPELGVEIGSHTCSHPILTHLAPEAMARELSESKRLLEGCLGRPCPDFAYPNGGLGDFDQRSRREVVRAGYRCALTTIKKRVAREDGAFEIPRCTFTHNRISVAEFAGKVSGFGDAMRAVRGGAGAARPPSGDGKRMT